MEWEQVGSLLSRPWIVGPLVILAYMAISSIRWTPSKPNDRQLIFNRIKEQLKHLDSWTSSDIDCKIINYSPGVGKPYTTVNIHNDDKTWLTIRTGTDTLQLHTIFSKRQMKTVRKLAERVIQHMRTTKTEQRLTEVLFALTTPMTNQKP